MTGRIPRRVGRVDNFDIVVRGGVNHIVSGIEASARDAAVNAFGHHQGRVVAGGIDRDAEHARKRFGEEVLEIVVVVFGVDVGGGKNELVDDGRLSGAGLPKFCERAQDNAVAHAVRDDVRLDGGALQGPQQLHKNGNRISTSLDV